ncbi:hypothetical protein E2C01_027608 [Portunus trituberculatus]|uniref:Uncharacterized protein n=1 Tax=Portunus trituberculatus TaxID=210409 RepID=A0A5B7ELB7_PORTR|nr:hypothetical protein [Portunus trituberculatus]
MSGASKVLAENEVQLIITCWQPRATPGPGSLSFTYTWLEMINLMDSSIHTYGISCNNVLHIRDTCSQVCDSKKMKEEERVGLALEDVSNKSQAKQ